MIQADDYRRDDKTHILGTVKIEKRKSGGAIQDKRAKVIDEGEEYHQDRVR